RMRALVIQHHPHRAGPHLRRKLVCRLARHGSTFSGVGASDKPGAVQRSLVIVFAILAVGGVVFPLVGASLIEMALIDWLAHRNAQPERALT
ncbi:MAG: hypothetical protein ACTHP8_05340, partial [Bosea sp. (in: a-proteobacteria)]